MKLSRLAINNFRLFEHVKIDFEDRLTILVGENDSGKTTILEALMRFFEKPTMSFDDYTRLRGSRKSETAYLEATFKLLEDDYKGAINGILNEKLRDKITIRRNLLSSWSSGEELENAAIVSDGGKLTPLNFQKIKEVLPKFNYIPRVDFLKDSFDANNPNPTELKLLEMAGFKLDLIESQVERAHIFESCSGALADRLNRWWLSDQKTQLRIDLDPRKLSMIQVTIKDKFGDFIRPSCRGAGFQSFLSYLIQVASIPSIPETNLIGNNKTLLLL